MYFTTMYHSVYTYGIGVLRLRKIVTHFKIEGGTFDGY